MRIHFISIGGAVMHNMAIALHNLGNHITGSDDEIFEPALSRLKSKRLLPENFNWDENRIDSSIDFIILGMHARNDNPELIKARNIGLKIYSFPEYVYEHSKNKIRIVVAGSHGKTSTTAMIMHVLKNCKIDFDYLVGSQLEGFETMVKLSNAKYIVIEGDEYLTSAIDLKPKFLWYKPHIAIITGIAWDHINVFPTYEIYKKQFEEFVKTIELNGTLIYCKNDEELKSIAQKALCNTQSYSLPDYKITNGNTNIIFENKSYELKIFGKHNLLNLNAAMAACKQIGVDEQVFLQEISNFKGAAKRLEKVFDNGNIKIFRDFAHSPSKLKATVKAAIEQFEGFTIIGVFELHTFSSLNESFLKEYKNSMNGLSKAIVYFNNHVFELKKMKPLSPILVKKMFGNIVVANNNADLLKIIKPLKPQTVVLLMSSGNFDSLKVEDLL
ncbi:MAG: peptidoglycan synthetase [Bacteroidetes bacterium]|nr:peptidoglycan synthetase [Bacteroidota bacterium]